MAKEIEEGKLTPNEGKLKALQAAMAKIEKDFGKGSIMKLGDEHVENIEVIPTGSIALDNALGVGGYPRGRIIEIYGPESSGKTTLAIHAIAEAQKAGGIAAFIDAEHAFDRFYAEKNNDINNMDHCRYVLKKENTGSGATRNFLCDICRFDWMLFLDCDMDIADNSFISKYIGMQGEPAVVNGGISIGKNPAMRHNLRYIYECEAESAHTAQKRNAMPYREFRSTNFMIHKSIMNVCRFDEKLMRYEDVLYGKMLKRHGFRIIHIDNPTVMNDFEENADFVRKAEKDMKTLHYFEKELQGFSRMLTFTNTLSHKMPLGIIRLWHKLFGSIERRVLTSRHPSLYIYNLYRLGYYLSLKK